MHIPKNFPKREHKSALFSQLCKNAHDVRSQATLRPGPGDGWAGATARSVRAKTNGTFHF